MQKEILRKILKLCGVFLHTSFTRLTDYAKNKLYDLNKLLQKDDITKKKKMFFEHGASLREQRVIYMFFMFQPVHYKGGIQLHHG